MTHQAPPHRVVARAVLPRVAQLAPRLGAAVPALGAGLARLTGRDHDLPAPPAGAAEAPLVETRRLRAGYGGVEVLHGVDLAVDAGTVLAVLGPNGAGKTTLLRVLAGLHQPSAGEVLLGGRRVSAADPVDLARRGLCLIPEGRGVFPSLTVRDNLRMMTYRRPGLTRAEVEERAIARFPKLGQRLDQPAGTMSGGEQQMLALARAIATDPAVLLLDELSMGLAPKVVGDLYATVRAIADENVTIIVVEQFANTVLEVADSAAVLVEGRVTVTGAPEDIAGLLASAYFGGGAAPAPPCGRQAVPPPAAAVPGAETTDPTLPVATSAGRHRRHDQ